MTPLLRFWPAATTSSTFSFPPRQEDIFLGYYDTSQNGRGGDLTGPMALTVLRKQHGGERDSAR